jgi:hypothetical protein
MVTPLLLCSLLVFELLHAAYESCDVKIPTGCLLAEARIADSSSQKRGQFFIRLHNVTLLLVAMCVCNPDRSPLTING